MLLKELLYGVKTISLSGITEREITALQIDSRAVQPGNCFIAIKGAVTDGHFFIETAIKNGATAIICETLPDNLKAEITYVQVAEASRAAGLMAHVFYGAPTTKLNLVGVTGTNGKTTVATLLHRLFTGLGYNCGLISTIQNEIGTEVFKTTHTTPDAIQLNALLQKMQQAGCQYVFMECSSHAIQQNRIAGLVFKGALFTNISHDHLDYHKTFDAYIQAKKQWFDELPTTAFAISNKDDKRGTVMLQNTKAKKYYYSLKTVADFKGKILESSLEGLHLTINEVEVFCRLIGEFNAYNLLAIYGAAICLQQNKEEVLINLSKLSAAEGRFDFQFSNSTNILGIVDYAHTPDALLNVLATIQKLRKGNEQLISVVGCGGNRDATKRPVMAQVACEYSDKVIFTSDNPRNEDPDQIIEDMIAGVPAAAKRKYLKVADRKEAIKTAVSLSNENDIILIAGKGHEKYQEIKNVRSNFDDKEILAEMFLLFEK